MEEINQLTKEKIEMINKINELNNILTLIKLRDSIKFLIDIFHKALANNNYGNYYQKSEKICELASINKKLMVIDNITDFFDTLIWNVDNSNDEAHEIKSNELLIEKLFYYIDPLKKYDNIKKILNVSKIEELLKSHIECKSKNYYNFDFENYMKEKKNILCKIKNLNDILNN